jgi:hypothetical protein
MSMVPGFDDAEETDFEDAKSIINRAIQACAEQGIDNAVVAAVLIGAGVSWYERYQGEAAILAVLSDTISDIQSGRHRIERWPQ